MKTYNAIENNTLTNSISLKYIFAILNLAVRDKGVSQGDSPHHFKSKNNHFVVT